MSDEQVSARKRAQVLATVKHVLAEQDDGAAREAADAFVRSFVVVTPPETTDDSGWGPDQPTPFGAGELFKVFPEIVGRKGRSTKPGNILLNLRKAFVSFTDSGFKLAGVLSLSHLSAILTILVVCAKLWGEAQIEVGDKEALVMWALWRNRDDAFTVSKEGALRFVNAEAASLGRPPLTKADVDGALKNLEDLKCIGTALNARDRYYLRESVIAYYK